MLRLLVRAVALRLTGVVVVPTLVQPLSRPVCTSLSLRLRLTLHKTSLALLPCCGSVARSRRPREHRWVLDERWCDVVTRVVRGAVVLALWIGVVVWQRRRITLLALWAGGRWRLLLACALRAAVLSHGLPRRRKPSGIRRLLWRARETLGIFMSKDVTVSKCRRLVCVVETSLNVGMTIILSKSRKVPALLVLTLASELSKCPIGRILRLASRRCGRVKVWR